MGPAVQYVDETSSATPGLNQSVDQFVNQFGTPVHYPGRGTAPASQVASAAAAAQEVQKGASKKDSKAVSSKKKSKNNSSKQDSKAVSSKKKSKKGCR